MDIPPTVCHRGNPFLKSFFWRGNLDYQCSSFASSQVIWFVSMSFITKYSQLHLLHISWQWASLQSLACWVPASWFQRWVRDLAMTWLQMANAHVQQAERRIRWLIVEGHRWSWTFHQMWVYFCSLAFICCVYQDNFLHFTGNMVAHSTWISFFSHHMGIFKTLWMQIWNYLCNDLLMQTNSTLIMRFVCGRKGSIKMQ